MVKAKKATKRPKGKDSESDKDGATPGATPPPAKQMHPSEQLKPRGFDRGLQAEKVRFVCSFLFKYTYHNVNLYYQVMANFELLL